MTSKLFADDQWDALKKDPETAKLFEDPEFAAMVKDMSDDPTSLSKYLTDPRIGKMFTTLAKSSNATAGAAAASEKAPAAGSTAPAAKAQDEVIVEDAEDLSKLSEEERNKKLALRAKDEGNVFYKARDFEKAIASYTKAIELDPNTVSFLTNRAAAHLESGAPDKAIDDCKLAVKLNIDNSLRTDFKIIARAYGRMGNAYVKQKMYGEAIEAFQKSLVEAKDAKIQRALNDTRAAKKKHDIESYIDPEISQRERAEGNELFKQGNYPESIKKYTEAIKRNPKDAAPYSNRAASYMKLGEFPMALRDCERCLDCDPNYVKAYIRKGNIHLFMKEYHKCLEVYEKGLKLAPDNRELKQGLLKTQMAIQQQQGSGQVDEKQVEAAMRDPEIRNILQDPQINNILKQMEQDPSFAAKAMSDPDIASKVSKLVAAGILRTG